MKRNTKTKKPVKKKGEGGVQKRKKYTEESVQKALQAIRDGMSKKLASKTYKVPRSTLQFKSKFPDKKSRPGPATALTTSEELCLKKWLIDCSKKGFPKRKDDLIASVAEFFKKNDRQNPFKDGIPGEKWYKLFLARHPDIAIRTPEAVTSSSSTVAEADIKHWFDDIEQYLVDNNFNDILKDPKRIYNGDETNFLLCPKSGVVLAAKGDKNVYEIDNAPAKTSLTVLFTFGADGKVTPPLVIFPQKRLSNELRSKIPSDWGIGFSDNGWMKSDIFKSYIENVLHPYLTKEGVEFPVILYVDGHKTHLTYEVSETCSKLNIVLIALYPNCTRILQPADVSAFKPMKTGWQKTVLAWRRSHPSQALTKHEFVPLLKKTIDESINTSIIINGFRATGLYPFNKNAVDYTKCLGKSKKNEQTIENEDREINGLQEMKMTLKDFKTIINEEKLRMLDDENDDVDEDLKKIYLYLTRTSNLHKQTKESNGYTKDTNLQEELNEANDKTENTNLQAEFKTGNDNTEDILQNSTMPSLEHFNLNNMNVTFADDFENEVVIEEIQEYDSQNVEPHVLEITHTAQIHTTPIKKTSNVHQIELEQFTHKENLAEPNAPVNYDKIEVLSITENSKFSCNTKTLKPININDVLVLPKTPERKGVRNTSKAPFVLTSAAWQELENKKRREKEEKQEGIRKRKEERERKKLEKLQMNKNGEKRKLKKEMTVTSKSNPVKKKILQPISSALTEKNTCSYHKGNKPDETQNQSNINDNDEDDELDYKPENTHRRYSKAYTTEELKKLLSEMEDSEDYV